MTIAPGLCSITFRALPADEVLAVAVRAGVEGIEWGADVHVPPGGGAHVEALAARSRDAGVEVVSYGSYLGMAPAAGRDAEAAAVEAVADSAGALGAPMVRIWTELGVTPDSPPAERARVVDRTVAIADTLAARGLAVALEFHPGTLTHTAASARALLERVGHPALRTHWQPDPALDAATALAELSAVTPWLAHLHVFAWGAGGITERRPLADGADLWPAALALADRDGAPLPAPGRRFALCEYVPGDDPEQLARDVAMLRAWLARG